jgi:CCR4-NOT transcription complex subunit 3
MEKFKALEKEMKMKAFSKEGLIAAARLDPAEKARREMVDWIGNTTEELSRQIEQTEAEQEQLQVAGKKKKSAVDRLSELEQLNERRQWHIGRLEIVQRMFENGQLGIDRVESIQEDVKYFVEANTEEDFDYDTGIYDELNLQDVEAEYVGDFGHHEDASTLDSASVADIQETTKTPQKEDKKSRSSHRSNADDDLLSSPVLTTKRSKSESKNFESVADRTRGREGGEGEGQGCCGRCRRRHQGRRGYSATTAIQRVRACAQGRPAPSNSVRRCGRGCRRRRAVRDYTPAERQGCAAISE